jgi:hypothetical protein
MTFSSAAKKSAPSVKNGRRSAKNRANGSLMSSCLASASTWLKSGFAVKLNVMFGVTPQLAVSPSSPSWASFSKSPSGKSGRVSALKAMTVGSSSMLRPGRTSSNP